MPTALLNKRIVLAVIMSLTGIITVALWAVQETQRSVRIDPFKQQRLGSTSHLKHDMKSTRGFALSIVADEDSSARLRLRGTIVADKPIEALEFNWILPEGYAGSDSQRSGTLSILKPGEKFDLPIEIKRAGLPAQAIVLHIYRLVDGEPQGQIVQFDPDSTAHRDAHDSSAVKIKLNPGERLIQ